MSRQPDRSPGLFAWWLAFISLVLPWAGGGLALYGALGWSRDVPGSWQFVAGGLALVALDIVIDLVWAHPSVSPSDEPALNARAVQLIGRVCVASEAFRNGRGKVRIGDSVWVADGPDADEGSLLRVSGCRGTVLTVEPADGEGPVTPRK